MVKKYLSIVFVAGLLIAGCGKSIPVISSPTDGQKIALDQAPCFQVALADNDYQNTTIEVRGTEQFGSELTCTPGNYAPANCCRTVQQNQQFNSFNQTCVEGRPCVLVFIARRGDAVDVKTANVIRTSQVAPGQTPPR